MLTRKTARLALALLALVTISSTEASAQLGLTGGRNGGPIEDEPIQVDQTIGVGSGGGATGGKSIPKPGGRVTPPMPSPGSPVGPNVIDAETRTKAEKMLAVARREVSKLDEDLWYHVKMRARAAYSYSATGGSPAEEERYWSHQRRIEELQRARFGKLKQTLSDLKKVLPHKTGELDRRIGIATSRHQALYGLTQQKFFPQNYHYSADIEDVPVDPADRNRWLNTPN